MTFNATEIIISSPFSGWAALMSVLILTVGAFSFATKQFEKERNKKAIQNLLDICHLAGQKFVEANRIDEPSLRTQRVVLWFGVGILCAFSAIMYLWSFVAMGLMIEQEATGLKATLISLFALALMILANMYRVSARKMRLEIDNL